MAIRFDRSKAPKGTERRKYDWNKLFNGRTHFVSVSESADTFDNGAKTRFLRAVKNNETSYEKLVVFKVVVNGDEADLPKEGEEATHWCLWVE